MVVMETGVSYYENVHTSDTKRIHCPFGQKAAGSFEWVQWAKPRRHNAYKEKRDDLVLVREDGLLQYFQIEKASSAKFNLNWTIGGLGIRVDTAFCMLAGPPGKGGDIFIVGGSMTDGGVFHVSARGFPECTQAIESICPLRDMILGPSGSMQDGPWSQESPDRLYACCSRPQGSGALFDIRCGLEAQVGWTVPFPDASFIDRMWTLELPDQNELLVLGSQPTQTTMVAFELDTQELSFTNSESHPGFDFENQTLAAAVLDQGFIIQVTTGSVNLIPTGRDAPASEFFQIKGELHQAVLFEEDQMLVTASKGASGYDICLAAILTSADGGAQVKPAAPTHLADVPTAVCCLKLQNSCIVLVGTDTAKILGYTVSRDLSLDLAFQYEVQDFDARIEGSAISSLVALQQSNDGPVLVLCGLRYGVLLCLELRLETGLLGTEYSSRNRDLH
jgi:hypothetical protein